MSIYLLSAYLCPPVTFFINGLCSDFYIPYNYATTFLYYYLMYKQTYFAYALWIFFRKYYPLHTFNFKTCFLFMEGGENKLKEIVVISFDYS